MVVLGLKIRFTQVSVGSSPTFGTQGDKDLRRFVVSPFSLAGGQTPTKPHHFFSPRRHSSSLPASPRPENQRIQSGHGSVQKAGATVTPGTWMPPIICLCRPGSVGF